MRANTQRTKNQQAVRLEHRRALVSDYYLRGMTLNAISQMLANKHSISVSYQTVKNDLDTIRQDWKNSAKLDFHFERTKRLRVLQKVQSEAWQAWYEQADTAKRDARYLGLIAKAVSDEIKVLGLHQLPVLVEPANEPNEPDFSALSLSELQQLRQLTQKIKSTAIA